MSGPLCTALPGHASPCTTPLGSELRLSLDRQGRLAKLRIQVPPTPPGPAPRPRRAGPGWPGWPPPDTTTRAPAPLRRPRRPGPPASTAARLPRDIKGMQPPQRHPQHPELRQRRPDQRPLDERSSQREPHSVQPDRIAGVGPDHPRRRVARRLQAVQGRRLGQQPVQHGHAGAPLTWTGTGASSRQARTTHGAGRRPGRPGRSRPRWRRPRRPGGAQTGSIPRR